MAENVFELRIISPDEVFYEGESSFLEFASVEGEMGDAQWPDEIDVNRAEEAKKRAEERLNSKSDSIDVARAEAALKRAMARINGAK